MVYCALWLTLLAVAGCDVSSSTPKTSSQTPARTEKLKTNFTVDEARELAAPASTTPGLSVDVGAAQAMATGNEGFQTEAKGFVSKRLFDQAAANDDERFERLEAAMQLLRDDFDAVSPSMNRLMAIEREIQTLVDQLQVLVDGDADLSSVPPVTAEAMDAPITDGGTQTMLPPVMADVPPPPIPMERPMPIVTPTPSPVAPAPAATVAPPVSGPMLVAARVADHAGKTRIVLETDGNIPYTADVDPEQILIVTFASGSASSGISSTTMKSSMVKSIDVTPQNGGGMILAMPLSKATKIIGQGVLKPDGANKNYRIYIDLSR